MRKYTIHIDMSGKFYEYKDIGIAFIAAEDKCFHKGTALSGKLVKTIIQMNNLKGDYADLYSICIYNIIKDDVTQFKKIIICNDEPTKKVIKYLNILFDNDELNEVEICSIDEYKKQIEKKVMSEADGRANSYRKRGLFKRKWNKGTKLNFIETDLKTINSLLEKIRVSNDSSNQSHKR